MAKRQYFGIKYPFTNESLLNYYVDLNESRANGVRSQLLHLLFTPKGQRLRDPEFGTDLIKFIFNPDDSQTWESIKHEISTAVNKYIGHVSIKNIEVARSEEEMAEVFVKIEYIVHEGNQNTEDKVVIKL